MTTFIPSRNDHFFLRWEQLRSSILRLWSLQRSSVACGHYAVSWHSRTYLLSASSKFVSLTFPWFPPPHSSFPHQSLVTTTLLSHFLLFSSFKVHQLYPWHSQYSWSPLFIYFFFFCRWKVPVIFVLGMGGNFAFWQFLQCLEHGENRDLETIFARWKSQLYEESSRYCESSSPMGTKCHVVQTLLLGTHAFVLSLCALGSS